MFKTLTLTTLAAALMFAVAPAYAGTGDNGAKMNGSLFNGAKMNGTGDNGSKLNGSLFNGAKLNGTGDNGVRANGKSTNGKSCNGVMSQGTNPVGPSMDASTTLRIIAVELPATN